MFLGETNLQKTAQTSVKTRGTIWEPMYMVESQTVFLLLPDMKEEINKHVMFIGPTVP